MSVAVITTVRNTPTPHPLLAGWSLKAAGLDSHTFPFHTMSVTYATQESYGCNFPDCDDTFTPSSSVAGSFCSKECAARDRGRRILNLLRYDHRFCWSCWRERKEIEQPTAEARRGLGPVTDGAVVGYEYLTEHAEMGPYGTECHCGAVDHDVDGWDRRDDAPYRSHLALIVERTREEGQHEYGFDADRFDAVLDQTDDLELALGAALRAGD